jgi:hypothetical protein
MFTAENFRRIFDAENRKGLDVATRFFPGLEPMTHAVREKVSEIRRWRKSAVARPALEQESGLSALRAQLAELKEIKSVAVDDLMTNLSKSVGLPGFRLQLDKKTGPEGKAVYCIDGSPETFFVVKQLQRNVHRLYKVKQSNRHDLACQIRDTVGTGFPFELVRTDLSNFYESIDRDALYAKLDGDQLLSSSSKRFIRQIFASYQTLSGSPKGIPRGVGISAYLAELFLRPLDRAVTAMPGIVLYCRYVDDIVAVFARPPSGADLGSYKDRVVATITKEGLTHNAGKTEELNLGDKGGPKRFEYLGYSFSATLRTLTIAPSDAKVAKLGARLDAAFDQYRHSSPTRQRQAYRELVGRIKFLTGNSRLKNSKSGATTGIFYNSSLTTDMAKFDQLDALLKKRIKAVKRPSLRASLMRFGFRSGFEERRFHNFSPRELRTIVGAWRHV